MTVPTCDGVMPKPFMNIEGFFADFQDYLAPKLDTYEQVVYLYVFRHSRLVGEEEVTIGFKSARKKMALGIGKKGSAMSEGTCYEKLRSLEAKGCLQILGSEQDGTRIRLRLPDEMPGLIPRPCDAIPPGLEDMDFFEVPENRAAILEREGHRCFYCLRRIDAETHVIEHVNSRPQGDNSYRNVVAACRRCNNRKGPSSAEDFLRTLYRDGFLEAVELEDRLTHLGRLTAGDLKPALPGRHPQPG